ncbi:alanine racemase [Acidipropionibacterium jensenii]|uniref:alanine racemase n=1 Tax=Acidipropionibacterium jensenii TaxID=1749 RepID=UPI00110A666D|nr:alanine racemase [Acidipropionibacterium jensenii]QCV87677.1 alanine racemase [Acidipropionibacterium jensenii]
MSLVLHVDAAAWRSHQDAVVAAREGIVPVAKGNGYGFGLGRLGAEAARLGCDVLAVGTAEEVAAVRAGIPGDSESGAGSGFSGDVVVLTPWRPGDPVAEQLISDPHVITTLSRVDDVAAVAAGHPGARVILEALTSMARYGLEPGQFAEAVAAAGPLEIVGWTIHLPMIGEHLGEATDLATSALAAHRAPLWVSHLSAGDLDRFRRTFDVPVRPRIGTELWLGAHGAMRYLASVQDVHEVTAGQRVGYWQRRAGRRHHHLAVVSGGTANGVAMQAPTAAATLRQVVQTLANGAMEAGRLALSPYSAGGHKLFFAEPPHMQASLLWAPPSVHVGDELEVTMRATTATPDQLILD